MKKAAPVNVVYQRCCGLDVHKDSVAACVIDEQEKAEMRTFGTQTRPASVKGIDPLPDRYR